MRSFLTLSMADRVKALAAGHASSETPAAGGSPVGFSAEIAAAAAAQVFANGLAEMWAHRRDARTARPIVDLQERRALMAKLTDRAEALAKRAQVAPDRPRTASGFA